MAVHSNSGTDTVGDSQWATMGDSDLEEDGRLVEASIEGKERRCSLAAFAGILLSCYSSDSRS